MPLGDRSQRELFYLDFFNKKAAKVFAFAALKFFDQITLSRSCPPRCGRRE